MIRNALILPAGIVDRYALHGIDDMFVEAWEKAKAVLTRQVLAAVHTRMRSWDAPGLAPRYVAEFVDLDFESAVQQLVGSAHPGNASANYHDLRHAYGFPNPMISSLPG